MAADGSIFIEVKVDTTDAEKEIKGLNKTADDISDTFQEAEKSTFSLGDAVKSNLLSSAIMSGFGVLTDSVKSFASGVVTAAADIKAEASQFTQTFGEMEGTATEVISGIAQQTGILETRLNSAATSVYAFARSSGGSKIESMELMEGALTAAADAAAYYDRSLDETTDQLMSFLKGNYENDAALGLSATETTRNAAAMEQFGKEFNDLTEIQKQQTLLKMVQDAQELSGAMGQASRESDGLENVMGNLSEVGRQIQGNIGAPVLEAIIPSIQEITNALSQWAEGVNWTAFGETVSSFITGIIDNGPTILSIIAGIGAGLLAWKATSMIQGVISAVTSLVPALTGATAAQTGLNTVMAANPVGLIVTAIAALVGILVTLWNTNEGFRDAVTGIWEKIKAVFVNAWEAIKSVWDAVKPYFEAIWEAIKSAFSAVSDVLGGFFSAAWDAIKAVWDTVTGYFEAVWNTIKGIFSVVKSVLSGDFEGAWEAIKGIFSGWKDFFTGLWDDLTDIFGNVLEFFTNIGKNIINGIKNGISSAWDGLKNWFNGLWDGLLGNKTASVTVENSTAPRAASLDAASRMIADIPRLAAGSVVPPNREFLAVLGDNTREAEVVSPVSTMKQAFIEAMREMGMGDGTINLTVNLDGKTVAKNTINHINRMTQQSGKPVLLV